MLQGLSEFFNSFNNIFEMIASSFRLVVNMIAGWFSFLDRAGSFVEEATAFFPSFLQGALFALFGLAVFALLIKLCPFIG